MSGEWGSSALRQSEEGGKEQGGREKGGRGRGKGRGWGWGREKGGREGGREAGAGGRGGAGKGEGEGEGEGGRVREEGSEWVSPDLPCRWFQHCEVEKRQRERMNRYMNELVQMIPACSEVPRRLDKLSILKMAVDHMKSLRGVCACACVQAYLRAGIPAHVCA